MTIVLETIRKCYRCNILLYY